MMMPTDLLIVCAAIRSGSFELDVRGDGANDVFSSRSLDVVNARREVERHDCEM
jgi:hypothetical protein